MQIMGREAFRRPFPAIQVNTGELKPTVSAVVPLAGYVGVFVDPVSSRYGCCMGKATLNMHCRRDRG